MTDLHDAIRRGACPVHYIPSDDTGQGSYLVNESGDTVARGFSDRASAQQWADAYGYLILTGTGRV